jgi:predicted metal-binding membrane protein
VVCCLLFGGVAHLGDWGLHEAVEHNEWLETNVWIIGSGTIVLAGLYQFTPLTTAWRSAARP